ncbi:Ig-like domain-containing protein, partial [Ramlibacter sp. MAHUQ-53]|uniref:Ig-like domain-containing protein n=1 Tax=unclassified Ramlibacter TaxID=2617605 RepID=UPI003629D3C8
NNGDWASTAAAQSALADGNYRFRAVVTDAAGNDATSNVLEVVIDNTDPAPGVLSFTDLTDTGSDDPIDITQDNAFNLSLAGHESTANVVYQVSFNNGDWTSTTAAQSALADGNYRYRAVVTDAADNDAISNVLEVVIDNTLPQFSSSTTASIPENSPLSAVVHTAQASDLHGVNFSLAAGLGDDAAKFAIDAATGAVTLLENADFETKSSYAFTVQAVDAAGNVATRAVTLGIIDINEAPEAKGGTVSTVENAPLLIPLAQEYATDPDAGNVLTLVSVTASHYSWGTGGTATTLTNPVTKQAVNIAGLTSQLTISSDGKSALFTPAAELNWMMSTQQLSVELHYTVRDQSGMTDSNTITVTIIGSTSDKGKNLTGTNGADILVGSDNEDVLQGGNGNDNLSGGKLTDALYGGNGDDLLSGGDGIDYLFGDSGNDTLNGDDGADVLSGGKGNDAMIGGLGNDHFVFEPQLGADRLTGFVKGQDMLHFVDMFPSTLTAADFVTKYVTDTGNDLLISVPGGSVVLVGVADTSGLAGSISFVLPS